MKMETKKILLAVLVISLVLVSGLSAITANASAQQGAFQPSKEMKLITQPGNNVTFPLGSVGVSLPNAINPLYTKEEAPTGTIQFIPGTIGGRLPFTFMLQADFSQGLPPYTYQWIYNGHVVGTSEYLIYTANSPGIYRFTVKVTDQAFNTGVATKVVQVGNPLQASMTASNSTKTVNPLSSNDVSYEPQLRIVLGHTVNFKVYASGGTPWTHEYYKVHISYGDGNSNVIFSNNTPISISHSYNHIGTYVARLYVEDSQGVTTNAMYFVIQVIPAPLNTSLEIGTTPIMYNHANDLPVFLINTPIEFNGTILGGETPYTVYWNFGDGHNETDSGIYTSHVSAVHSYAFAGLYTVWMNVTYCNGEWSNKSVEFYVRYIPPENPTLHIGSNSSDATHTTYTTYLYNGVAHVELNLSWEYGDAPYTVYLYVTHNGTTHVHTYTVNSLSDVPYYVTYSADDLGTYLFNYTVRDSRGYSNFSTSVTLKVLAPQFSVDISSNTNIVCQPGTVVLTVHVNNIQGKLNTTTGYYQAGINLTVYQDGVIINNTLNLTVNGATEFFQYTWTHTVNVTGTGTHNFYAVASEVWYYRKANTTSNTITIQSVNQVALHRVDWEASPLSLQGVAPLTVTFFMNLSGGNTTDGLLYFRHIYKGSAMIPIDETSGVITQYTGIPCDPHWYLEDSYTFLNGGIYRVQYIFYSNTTGHNQPVYVNYTVTVSPPPQMVASFEVAPPLIYLENGPNGTIYNDIGYYNYTNIYINITAGVVPYHVTLYLGPYVHTYTSWSPTTGVTGVKQGDYLNFTITVPVHLIVHAYYTTPGSYNLSVVIHDSSSSGSSCGYSMTRTLIVVDVPHLNLIADAGQTVPTNIVAYGQVTGGAMPYRVISLSIDGHTFAGEMDNNFGYATGNLQITNSGTYTVTFTIKDANGYTWTTSTSVTVQSPSISHVAIISARMQVYFDNTLVYAGPAVWNETGTLNATFLMPNQEYAQSRVFYVNVSYAYTLYIPPGYYGNTQPRYYNVYSGYPYNSEPGKLTVVVGGMLADVSMTKDIATIKTLIDGTWNTVNVSYAYLRDNINPALVQIKNGIADLKVAGAEIQANLSALDAKIVDVQNGIATIQTVLGNIQANLTDLNAKIVDVQNGIAVLQTMGGEVLANLSALNAKIVDVQNGIATIQTTLGTVQTSLDSLNATVTSIQNGVAVLQTMGGEVLANLSALNAKIVDVQGALVTLQTNLGYVNATLNDLKPVIMNINGTVMEIQTVVGEINMNLTDFHNAMVTMIQNGMAMVTGEINGLNVTMQAQLSALNATIVGEIQNGMVMVETMYGEIQANLTALNSNIVDVQNGIATIQTTLGTIKTDLSNLNGKITDIQNGIATIQTDIGNIQTSLNNLNAKITKLQGDVATIQTTLGTVQVKLNAINATVVSNAKGISDLKGSVVEIQTTLGTIKGTVTDIKDGVATIQTNLGTVQTDVNNIKTNTANTANSVNTTLYWEIGVLILVIITLALVAYVIVQVNKIAKKEELEEEETEE